MIWSDGQTSDYTVLLLYGIYASFLDCEKEMYNNNKMENALMCASIHATFES